ncbi:MAG: hypothetical protein MH252_02915 [Thermosynechococcaceae cyanobacterium MS004]|nr:hypothetical protein [Thermosynechococcaceae cyanobacterium MS004]
MKAIQLELDFQSALAQALAEPEVADLRQLWRSLDPALLGLTQKEQFRVAGQALWTSWAAGWVWAGATRGLLCGRECPGWFTSMTEKIQVPAPRFELHEFVTLHWNDFEYSTRIMEDSFQLRAQEWAYQVTQASNELDEGRFFNESALESRLVSG